MNIATLLDHSRASDPFRVAVARFLESGRPCERVRFDLRAPSVKVERTITKILEAYGDLPIEAVELQASSGCEFFRGVALIRCAEEERHVEFHWDCKWRAEREGWTDCFGFVDQARAAREFGYDCFRRWNETRVLQKQRA
ncbi:MAG: hypothetical protein M3409_02085 [Gemmatimonadota bacterium]|jgi:hypothetical protein|nr:hypothetical protein [Gemmatimonadota bacterium]